VCVPRKLKDPRKDDERRDPGKDKKETRKKRKDLGKDLVGCDGSCDEGTSRNHSSGREQQFFMPTASPR
jgi:hypothetical protein